MIWVLDAWKIPKRIKLFKDDHDSRMMIDEPSVEEKKLSYFHFSSLILLIDLMQFVPLLFPFFQYGNWGTSQNVYYYKEIEVVTTKSDLLQYL